VTGQFQFCLAAHLDARIHWKGRTITSSLSQPLLQEEVISAKAAPQSGVFLVRLGIGFGLVAYLAQSKVISFHALSKLFTAWPITLAALTASFFLTPL